MIGTHGDELVVLTAENGAPIGVTPKATVHTRETPLHLAFSCYVLDERGRTLLTRRALGKRTWPGVWSNTCCGHPAPGESVRDAVRRRLGEELRLPLESLRTVLPDFRYRAVAPDGIVENEICPVLFASSEGAEPEPDPNEVMDWAWVALADFARAARATPMAFSPWAVLQLRELERAGLVGSAVAGAGIRRPVTPGGTDAAPRARGGAG